jgi:hypothetical protein
LSKAKA